MEIRPIDANALIEWIMPYLHTGDTVEVDTILEDIRAQPTLSLQWISVEDRLPAEEKYNGTVLATGGDIVITAPSSSVTRTGAITHWMPLPQPPKEAQP